MYEEYTHFVDALQTIESDTLWRYIHLNKYISLLSTKSLYFARIDRLDDPHEGQWPIPGSLPAELAIPEEQKNFRELSKNHTFVNCWCAEQEGSLPMWGLYADKKHGIAIKTSVESLISSLADSPYKEYIRPVTYGYYQQGRDDIIDVLLNFYYKRSEFSVEREVRVLVAPWLDPLRRTLRKGTGNVRDVFTQSELEPPPVNVNTLVHEVIVSPYADEWFISVVKEVTDRFEFQFPVNPSET